MDDLPYLLALHSAPRIGPQVLNQICSLSCPLSEVFKKPALLKTLELNLKPPQFEALKQAITSPDWKTVEQTLKWAKSNDNHILLISQKNYPE